MSMIQQNEETQRFDALLRHDFKMFVRKVFAEVSPQTKYLDNWHIDVICGELEKMLYGENTRLIINIPPRYMKSIICSVALPAYILGKFPKETVVCVSYADELAKKLAADCRRILETPWYKRAFPGTRLALNRRELMDFETTQGGGRYSTTVGGTLTGRGGNWLIIDDPIKPADANSDLLRNKVNEWYGNTLYSRLNDKNKGKILLIMQRTHEQDLTGYLLESKAGFKQIVMPLVAVREEHWQWKKYLEDKVITHHYTRKVGEALHPVREGLDRIEETKQSLGAMAFACQCQQDPLAQGGNIIHWDWFPRYNVKEIIHKHCLGQIELWQLVFSWDIATKTGATNDYSVCVCAMRSHNKYYILDIKRWKLELPDLVKAAKEYMSQQKERLGKLIMYPGKMLETRVLVEDVGCGIGFQQALKPLGYKVDFIHPTEDKKTRCLNITPLLEQGCCLLPDTEEQRFDDFRHEVLGFPNTKHDDQVDALTQLLNFKAKKRFDFI